MNVDEALARSRLLTLTDGEVIAAIDAKQLKGSVRKALPGLQTVAYVSQGDYDDWKHQHQKGTTDA